MDYYSDVHYDIMELEGQILNNDDVGVLIE